MRKKTLMILMLCGILLCSGQTEAASVRFEGIELYQLEDNIGNLSADERAAVVELRLKFLAENPQVVLEAHEVPFPGGVDMVVGDQVVFSITDQEAARVSRTSGQLARERWEIVRLALEEYRTSRSEQGVWIRIALVAAGSFFSYLAWRLLHFFTPRIAEQLRRMEGEKVLLPKSLGGFLRRQAVRISLLLLRPLKLSLQAILLCGYVILLLKLFPASLPYVEKILEAVLLPAGEMAVAIFDYLPNMVTIAMFILLSRYLLKFMHYLALQVEAREIVVEGFDAEWGKPTYNIIRFLVLALTLIAIFPYLPGAQSPVFQGISVFIGLLISLGSSSMVNNVFSGFVLIYTKAYRIGDYIMVGVHFGKVLERSILVTRLLTPKNETVTLPNSTMLGSNIINYSVQAATTGLILHSEVTIGYDVPWRQVSELLRAAALKTEGILVEPPPFVLQTGLSDFYVKYELNAFTRQADKIPLLYSRLHQNIQDLFHQAEVEIMSPHYMAWRNGEASAIPKNIPLKKEEAECKE